MEVSPGNHCPGLKDGIFRLWFRFLNRGRRLAGLAGTDSHACDFYPPGSERLYCRVAGKVTRKKLVEAMGQGRSFVASGPALVFLEINGRIPGQEVRLPVLPGTVAVRLSVRSLMPLDSVELIANGRAVRTWNVGGAVFASSEDWVHPAASNLVCRWETTVCQRVEAAGWMLATVRAKGQQGRIAFTNPVYLVRDSIPARGRKVTEKNGKKR